MSAVLEELTRVVGGLPPELAREVLDFARSMELRRASAVDDSTEWSEADMREASLAAMRRFEADHPGEVWGESLDERGPDDVAAR